MIWTMTSYDTGSTLKPNMKLTTQTDQQKIQHNEGIHLELEYSRLADQLNVLTYPGKLLISIVSKLRHAHCSVSSYQSNSWSCASTTTVGVKRTKQIIHNRATATLRRAQIKKYTKSKDTGGLQNQPKNYINLTKYEAVHPTAVSENNSSSGMLII